MGKRKDKPLEIEVSHRPVDLIMTASPPERIYLHVFQRIVHPAHVPFIVETKSAFFNRLRYTGIVRGILGDQHDVFKGLIEVIVHLFEEVNGTVVDASVLIAHPVNAVVDGIHADTVKVVSMQPEGRTGHQIALYVAF